MVDFVFNQSFRRTMKRLAEEPTRDANKIPVSARGTRVNTAGWTLSHDMLTDPVFPLNSVNGYERAHG